MEEYSKILTKEFSYAMWKPLAEITLIAIQVFNHCRAGGTERILIKDFKNHECDYGTGSIKIVYKIHLIRPMTILDLLFAVNYIELFQYC